MSKKSKTPCMNPLFLSWLESWRDEAKEKGLNAQWTYEKAIKSLRKYPLPLRSGKDAKILENIGDGIAKKLDKALDEFITNGGDLSEMHALPAQLLPSHNATTKHVGGSRKKPAPKKDATSSDSQSDKQEPEVKKRKKEYLPKQRTGPFALLLTMYRESQDPTCKGYLSKDELQEKAEPFIEKSFSVAEPGTHYTPWSSMSTLTAKGLTTRYSNPAKYSITAEGIALGKKLDAIEKANPSFKTPSISHFTLTDPTTASSSQIRTSTFDLNNPKPSTSSQLVDDQRPLTYPGFGGIAGNNESFCFWYVEENGNLSVKKDDAFVTVEDNCVWFLIKCEENILQRCSALYKIDESRPKQGEFVFAFLADQDAKNTADPPKRFAGSSSNKVVNKHVTPISVEKVASQPISRVPEFPCERSESSAVPLFVLRPGTFEIVLCVDQMEVAGGANTNSKRMMLEQLKRINAKMDIRKLQLGDFLWIAREKFPRSGIKREVVLDFIVERKRMDDLAGSIVDGRFKEQKFRLKSCGLKHPIYLIESYGSMQHMVLPEATLKQAIINSQIIDGLFIRKTDSIHDSSAYLSRMTQHLESIYQDKTIMVYPSEHIKSTKEYKNFREIIQEDVQKFMTFNDFYQTTNKNKMLSVKEMFAKQLMQLKGISADKAASIVDAYETPRSLISAFERCASEQERDNLLSDLTYGKAKRKIGPMLASQVRMLYTSRTPLT